MRRFFFALLCIKQYVFTLTARLGVSTSIGGKIPFQNAGSPSVLYILVMQSRIPIIMLI